jgi:hypothetical protein
MRGGRPAFRAAWCAAVLALMRPAVAAAWQGAAAPAPAPAESITVAAGARYHAGVLHRFMAGSAYRDLWEMPIRVPVLDLATYAGGLHPTKEGGGLQSSSLRLETAAGAEFVFRLSDKGSSASAELKNTHMEQIYQDQVSAMHPAGAVISAPILDASGILHPTAVLVVMADDAALGKFRGTFGGRLGMIEEYPNVPKGEPGFGGAAKIIDSDDLLKLLDTDPREHVDARAFLAARLTDFLINDNDRHPGNWKWARLESGPRTQWQPIARDRDHAFIAFHGWLMSLARLASPRLVPFDDTPSVSGLTHNKGLDARLLAGLEKPVWDSVALALQSRITDSVIEVAVGAMPIEYQESAPLLAAVLKQRRDGLARTADQFYRQLAARVEVHGTDAADFAVISRDSSGAVDVRLESAGAAWYARRFDPGETSEILVYLHGGNDSAVIIGGARQSIPVRVIGGNGSNRLIDSSRVAGGQNPTYLYDAGTVSGVTYGLDTLFDRRPWEKKGGVLAPHGLDNGSRIQPVVDITFHYRVGMTPRLGFARYSYGFDRRPYASMVRLEGEYAFKFQGWRVGLTLDQRLESSPVHFTAFARVSDFQIVNYTGLGNATIDSGSTSGYFEVHQQQWLFRPAIALALGPYLDISLGPVFQHSVTDTLRSPYLAATLPYGVGSFNQAGVQLGLRYDWRGLRPDQERAGPRVMLKLDGSYYPRAMDVRSAFGSMTAVVGVSLALPLPTRPYLLVTAGAKKVLGTFPFYEAAFLGGEGTTRYMDTQRYAGDGLLWTSAELRIPLVQFKLLLPLRAGILGVAETGRVYAQGSSPGGWHPVTGAGIWLGPGDGSKVVTLLRTSDPVSAHVRLRIGLRF